MLSKKIFQIFFCFKLSNNCICDFRIVFYCSFKTNINNHKRKYKKSSQQICFLGDHLCKFNNALYSNTTFFLAVFLALFLALFFSFFIFFLLMFVFLYFFSGLIIKFVTPFVWPLSEAEKKSRNNPEYRL